MLKIIGLICIGLFLIVSYIMILKYFINILTSYAYLSIGNKTKEVKLNKKISMMIVIPVLREQNIICDTIDYFKNLSYENMDIHLVIAGTKREYLNLNDYGFKLSTKEVVEKYVKDKNFKSSFKIHVYEADDIDGGDRATQLNYAVQKVLENEQNIDIIGVYDADSRPSIQTLIEVSKNYMINANCSYQQPAFFLETVNNMTQNKENPILIANAIYQNTWSIISEIPMWVSYGKKRGNCNQYFYCIGHGEFFPVSVYKKYHFPEGEVTDGIQIGYRMSIAGENVNILKNYCSDDVPHSLNSLIHQHKRWFGGCMRLKEAYIWCKNNIENSKIKKTPLVGGYWSQFRWAFTVFLYLMNFGIACYFFINENISVFFVMMILLFAVYCYLIPIISTIITPIKSKANILSFILVPIAIFIKSIGPNIYLFNTILRRKTIYGKVER